MELELLEKKELPLLARVEVTFRIKHPNESTPKRNEVRDELATQLKVKKGHVIIDNMQVEFGKSETVGFAKVYKSEEDAKSIERKYILVRNKLLAAEPKKQKAEKPAKPEKAEKPEKPEKPEEQEKPKEAEKAEPAEKEEEPEKADETK